MNVPPLVAEAWLDLLTGCLARHVPALAARGAG
jgi:hypothetical protein